MRAWPFIPPDRIEIFTLQGPSAHAWLRAKIDSFRSAVLHKNGGVSPVISGTVAADFLMKMTRFNRLRAPHGGVFAS